MLKPNTRTLLENLYTFLFCIIGCYCCALLQLQFSLSSVLASATVGFVGSFIPKSKHYQQKRVIASLYTGSFSSMCSLSYFTTTLDILLLGLITAIVFNFLSNYLRGFGGKLGSIAFASSLVFILVQSSLGIIK